MEKYQVKDIYFSAAIKALDRYVDDPTSIQVVRRSNDKDRQFKFNEMIDPPTLYVTTYRNEENMCLYLPFTEETKNNYSCPKPHADFGSLLVKVKDEWNKNILKKFGKSAFTQKNGLMDVTFGFDRSVVCRALEGKKISGSMDVLKQDEFSLQLFFHTLSKYLVVRYSWDNSYDMKKSPTPLAYNWITKCLCWFKELSFELQFKNALRKRRQHKERTKLG